MSPSAEASTVDVEEYLEWVTFLARKLIDRYSLDAELLDELISAGSLGVVEASGRYERDTGIPFKQFARWRVVGAMIDYLRKSGELPASAYRDAKCLRGYAELGRAETETDSPKDPHVLAKALEKLTLGALLFRVAEADPEAAVPEEQSSPEELLQAKERSKLLRTQIEKLPDEEKEIVTGYYFRGLAFHEIASANEWSKGWVSKLHKRALKRLHAEWVELEASATEGER